MYSLCVVLVCLVQRIIGSAETETHYECGAHGKFEYCVDKEPGCVVGCHCHPGYYFDTDTKICEPNLKLTQFRRHYDYQPTRIPIMNLEPVTIPTMTSTLDPVNEKVEEIAKDTDDLGDWLYNQFFKTIENQVINNTKNDHMDTRRSGGGSPPTKPKRRSRKKSKKSKKKKFGKKSLRSKLLRITEDDSLFDSTSSSSSDESESSSSESGSDSSDDHDHRKIVMINKKPTPPLPSFIFLPNVETPFYPPIGLPAPPIVPMYPMIPVPPMGMMYPSGESSTTTCHPPAESSSATTPSNPEHNKPPPASSPANEDAPTSATEPTPETPPPSLRANSGRSRKHEDLNQNYPNINMGPRDNFVHKMREKIKKRNKRPLLQKYNDSELPPFLRMNLPAEYQPRATNDEPKLEDVDFKYLSQLIHKIDLNQTQPMASTNELPNIADLTALSRRSNYQNIPPKYRNYRTNFEETVPETFASTHKPRPMSKADEVNDTYFMNLGKQIASLIRKHNREVDIEIQRPSPQNNMPTADFLNENGFTQGRSYWERFVRSPLKTFLPYLKRNQMHSAEHLINIEDQVSMATSIARPFSLHELENMANHLQQSKFNEPKVKYESTERPAALRNQYKFDLLPLAPIIRQINRPIVSSNATDKSNLLNQKKGAPYSQRHYNDFARRAPPLVPQQVPNRTMIITTTNQPRPIEDRRKVNNLKNFLIMQSFKTPLQQQVSKIVQRNITNTKPISSSNQFMNPLLVNYKNVNHRNKNHNFNKYHIERAIVPYHLTIFKPTSTKNSYFHHQLHHFDFFDK